MAMELGSIPLNGLVLTEADVLPYDSQVEYLESTGTQYIDTGISMASNSAVPLKVSVDSYGVVNHGIIHNNVAAGTWLGVAHPIDLTDFRIYKDNYNTKVIRSYSDARHIHVWDGSSGFYENGVLVESFTAGVGTDDITGIPWYLGRLYDFYTGSPQTTDTKAYRIYSAQMWVNGVLVRDFIPVRKNGMGCLYDLATCRLFENAGTGAFLYGDDVQADVLIPRLANAVAVNTAISTINSNLKGIDEWLASGWKETAQLSVGSIASGWSFSPDNSNWNNKLRFYHWGCMGYVVGYARKSSAMAINTNSNNIGIISWPSGYTMLGAGGNLGDQRINMVINTDGTMSVVNVIAFSANAAMTIRAFIPRSTRLDFETVAPL